MSNISKIKVGETTYDLKDPNAVSSDLLKSTVGWTGKNKFDNHQDFFVGFIDVNSSKFVLQSNYYMGIIPVKPNTEYIITKQEGKTFRIALSTDKPANNVSFRYTEANHTGTEITVTTGANDNYLSILFWSSSNGDTGTYQQMADTVMVRDASITDDTYESYHESVEEVVEQIYADNGVLGAKNLLPNNATSQTINGVTFTVNADGSVTVNGTATASADLQCGSYNTPYYYDFVNKYKGTDRKFRFTGKTSNVRLQFWSTNFTVYDENAFAFPANINMNNFNFSIHVDNGATVNNETIYPMMILASDPDDTYVPYAMTNREITDAVNTLQNKINPLFNINTIDTTKTADDYPLGIFDIKLTSGTVISGITVGANMRGIASNNDGVLIAYVSGADGTTYVVTYSVGNGWVLKQVTVS